MERRFFLLLGFCGCNQDHMSLWLEGLVSQPVSPPPLPTTEARRAWVARRAEELEWELSLLVQVAAGSRLSLGRR